MRVRILIILLVLAVATGAAGQQRVPGKDTVLKGATIEVIQAYKPQVKQAPKPEWVPQLPPPDTMHTSVNYDDVPQQSLFYSYTSLPLHPLALGKDDQQRPFPDYVKLGAGNLNTIYLDAGIGGLYGKDYETDIHLHHLSQKGTVVNQQTALSGIEANGMLHTSDADWHVGLTGERNEYHYYGYPHDLYSYSADSVKQTYTTIRLVADVQNKDTAAEFTYHPAVNGSVYTARQNATETNFGFDVPVAYRFDKTVQAQLELKGALTNFKRDAGSVSNNYVELLPGFSFNNSMFHGHALLGLAAGKGKNYILPDILAAYTLPATSCSIYAGVQSTLRQNTYEQLSTENPYIFNNYLVRQSSKGEYFAGVQGGAGDHFTYTARLSYWDYQYLPAFINDDSDQKQFRIGYYNSDVTAISVQLGFRYKEGNKWSAGITGEFYRFNTGGENHVWNEPSTKIKGDFVIMPTPKLTFTAYLNIQGGIYAPDSYGRIIKLNTIADLGGSAEYQFVPRLSAFMQLNNILNDKYQRWLGYEAYGINIYGGLRLKF